MAGQVSEAASLVDTGEEALSRFALIVGKRNGLNDGQQSQRQLGIAKVGIGPADQRAG
jgi:hypothetical protein